MKFSYLTNASQSKSSEKFEQVSQHQLETEINNKSNTTNTASERAALTETTLETNNLRAPDESRFPLTSNETLLEGEFHVFCYWHN